MKKLSVAKLMTAVMILGVSSSSIVMAAERDRVDLVNSITEYVTYEVDEEELDETMEEFVEGLTMLTKEEKELLIWEDKALRPYIEKAQQLSIEKEEVTNEILEGAEEYFEERGDILLGKNSKIWDKLWDVMSEDQGRMTDYKEIIKASKVLSKSEKDILFKEQKRLDEIEKVIAEYYDKAEKETIELSKQIEENQKKIKEIKRETKDIWKKVYKEDVIY